MRPGPRHGPDQGSGTVWVLTWCLLLWFVTLSVLLTAGVRAERHRASLAADLAALAAAERTLAGEQEACRRAADTAEANNARLRSCLLDGPFAEVTVARSLRHWPVTLTAHARAGPADVEGIELDP
jgi:secretion/DNA translocation related TadE-like protein